jgi:hypothetical protein
MVQLKVLAGKDRGAAPVVQQFPFVVGRGASANWRIETAGVWDRHLQLDFDPHTGITATVLEGALADVNGQRFERAVLRNGDVIQFGAAKVQFWLGETRQHGFRVRETLTWLGFGALCLGQILLISSVLP